jgi:hypothetical protein
MDKVELKKIEIEPELLEQAARLGIDVTGVDERTLRLYLQKVETPQVPRPSASTTNGSTATASSAKTCDAGDPAVRCHRQPIGSDATDRPVCHGRSVAFR